MSHCVMHCEHVYCVKHVIHNLWQVCIPCVPIWAKIIKHRHVNAHKHTQPWAIILPHPSIIVKFLLGWFSTGRQEKEIGGAEPSHAVWENKEEEEEAKGDGGGGGGGGSLVPDLWIIAHVTKFISDSNDVVLLNGLFVVGKWSEPIRTFVGGTNAGDVTKPCLIQTEWAQLYLQMGLDHWPIKLLNCSLNIFSNLGSIFGIVGIHSPGHNIPNWICWYGIQC